MATYELSFEQTWEKIKNTLLEMGRMYKKIKNDPTNEGIQRRYAARIVTLDRDSQSLFSKLQKFDDQDKIGHMTILLNDFNDKFYDELGECKVVCRDIVNKLFSVANFQVLHKEGNQVMWKSLKNRYDELLKIIPK